MKALYRISFFLIFCVSLLIFPAVKAFTDSDLDGLSDETEKARGLDPYQYDTDQGGVGDGAEVLLDQTNPLDAKDDLKKDRDQDGLSNADELILGTSITNKDTDNDGLSDYEERQFGSYGYIKDSDNDGLSDSKEKLYHTNPLAWDTDGDGVSDGAEILIDGTDALDSKSFISRDKDADGLTDAEEVIFGTDKNKADTDGDGYNDAEEIARGYNPNGPGRLDYQKLLAGKKDPRSEGLTQPILSILEPELLKPYLALAEPEIILLLQGSAPPLTEAEIFIYAEDVEQESLKEKAGVDLKGTWTKKLNLTNFPPGDYSIYLALSASQGRILIKSNPQQISLPDLDQAETKQAEAKKAEALQNREGGAVVEPKMVNDSETQDDKKRSHSRLFIGLPILFLLMAGGGFLLFMLSKNRASQDEEEIEVVQSSAPSRVLQRREEGPHSDPSVQPPSGPKGEPAPPQSLRDISGKITSSRGAPPSNLPGINTSSAEEELDSNTEKNRLEELAKRMN